MADSFLYLSRTNPSRYSGLLDIYLIVLVFSIIFSLPTIIVYLLVFYWLSKNSISLTNSKIILSITSTLGVFITLTIIYSFRDFEITLGYCLTTFLVGLLLKINFNTKNKKL